MSQEIDYETMPPSARTMKQINEVFRDKLGGHVIAQIDHFNGLLEFWSLESRVVIVHAYRGDEGWDHYVQSKESNINRIIEELS